MEVLNGVPLDVEKLRRDWEENGFLVLHDFVPKTETAKLRQRMREMLTEFDPQKEMEREGLHIFSCKKQTVRSKSLCKQQPVSLSMVQQEEKKMSDEYFLNSAGKIEFFFEEDAFDDNKQLKQDKEHSINKVAHGTLHFTERCRCDTDSASSA